MEQKTTGTIESSSERYRGIKLKEQNNWFNYPPSLDAFAQDLKKGDQVELTTDGKNISFIKKIIEKNPLTTEEPIQTHKTQLIKTFTTTNAEDLDKQVNDFCKDNEVFAIQTHLFVTGSNPYTTIHSATIFYWQKKEEEQ